MLTDLSAAKPAPDTKAPTRTLVSQDQKGDFVWECAHCVQDALEHGRWNMALSILAQSRTSDCLYCRTLRGALGEVEPGWEAKWGTNGNMQLSKTSRTDTLTYCFVSPYPDNNKGRRSFQIFDIQSLFVSAISAPDNRLTPSVAVRVYTYGSHSSRPQLWFQIRAAVQPSHASIPGSKTV